MTVAVMPERWEKIQSLSLKKGAHSPNSTFCVMEAVAYVAGEPWSDAPECACPVISSLLRLWNDSLPTDADRDRLLKPLIPKLIGTRNKALEERRAMMCADWFVRVNTPAWLRLAGLKDQAKLIEELPEITSMAQLSSIRGPLEDARNDADAAWDAALAAAGAAARDAAFDAALAAAGAAALAAAGAAAWAAARDTVGDAAFDAAGAVALGATTGKLAATRNDLQLSAVELVERMIEIKS